MAVAHWEAIAEQAHKDAYSLGRGAARDRLSPPRSRSRCGNRADLGRRCSQGARFDRFVEFIGPDGKVCVRSRTQWAIIDKAIGPPDPGTARSDSAVRFARVSTRRCAGSSSTITGRSSACYRVRIALNLKRVDYEVRQVNLLEGEQKSDDYRASEPAGPRADARDRRTSPDAKPRDHQLSRHPLSRPAAHSSRCGRASPCRCDGDDNCMRHPSAEQSARSQISEERARPFAGRGRPLVCALDQRRPHRARGLGRAQGRQIPVR